MRPRRAVVGDDVLAFGRRRQRRLRLVERGAGEQRRQPLDAGDSHTALVPMAGERCERIGLGERGEVARVEPRAMREVGDARERRSRARGDDARSARFGQPADEAQAEAQRRLAQSAHRRRSAVVDGSARQPALERAVPLADRHVDRPHLDAVPARIADELRRRVEAHRLGVEQRAQEGRRLVALEPADT